MKVIGIGTDIVECLRIAKMIEKHDEMFLKRVYTQREIDYSSRSKASTEHYAGRWAAKEAVLKALGTGLRGGIRWTDIEVRNDADGRPRIAFGGQAKRTCEQLGISDLQISISHCRTHATAFAIACGGSVSDSDSIPF